MKVLKSGSILYEDRDDLIPRGHNFGSNEELIAGMQISDSLYHATGDLDHLADKGVYLILLNQYMNAIQLYEEIERKKPARYTTASNLGTAYELAGENRKALEWIKRGITINPASHDSSEWIHVNILQVKLNKATSNWRIALIGTDFGNNNLPTTTLSNSEINKLFSALYYQLNERVSFIKPKDSIVAQLMFDLGNLAFLQHRYNLSYKIYKLASGYGYEGKIIEARADESKARMNNQEAKALGISLSNRATTLILLLIVGITIALLMIILWRYRC